MRTPRTWLRDRTQARDAARTEHYDALIREAQAGHVDTAAYLHESAARDAAANPYRGMAEARAAAERLAFSSHEAARAGDRDGAQALWDQARAARDESDAIFARGNATAQDDAG